MLGLSEGGSTISNSYSIGVVTGTAGVGGLVGYNGSTITNSYYNSETSGQSSGIGKGDNTQPVDGKTTAEMQQQTTFSGWDFNDVWTIAENTTFPRLRAVYNNPIILAMLSKSAKIGEEYTDTVEVVVMDNTDIMITLEGAPVGMQMSSNIIKWIPTEAGNHNVTVVATDGSGAVSKYTYTIAVLYEEEGTEADPYQITTIEELNNIRNYLSSHFILMNNLDFNGTAYDSNSSEGWQPLGDSGTQFTGSFNGDGHSITNLYINRPSAGCIGLFGCTSGATIGSLGLVDCNVTGAAAVGSLVGVNEGSAVSNSYSTGTVSGTDYVGGLVGGDFSSSSVSNCYFIGTILGTSAVGGLLGLSEGGSTISNSYSIGVVTGTADVGGLVGYNGSSVTNSYYNSETSGQSSGIGKDDNDQTVEGKTTAEMQLQTTFSGWDFSGIWYMVSDYNNGYPVFIWQLSHDATLIDLQVDGEMVPGFSPTTFTYDVELPYGTITPPTVSATTNDVDATEEITQVAALPGTATVTVTAGDGTTQQIYLVNFTIAPSTDATLIDLQVDGATIPGFSPTTFMYDVELPYGTITPPTVSATTNNVDAIEETTQVAALPGTATVTVTAGDGTTQQIYLVNFTIAPSTDATLIDLQVDGATIPGFSPTTFMYDVELPYGTITPPTVSATTNNVDATEETIQAMALPGNATVLVTAGDGTQQSYTVQFSILLGTNSLAMREIEFMPNPVVDELTIQVPAGITVSVIGVYSQTGSLVYKQANVGEVYRLVVDMSGLVPGVYTVRVTDNKGGSRIEKIIKR